jgi:hypothetical protein
MDILCSTSELSLLRRSEGESNPRPKITHRLRPAAGNRSRGGEGRPDMLLGRAFALRRVAEARGSNPLGAKEHLAR